MEIRDITDDDWSTIYPFFTKIVESGESYAYPLGLSPQAARALWTVEPPGRTVVAVDGGRVLGTAHMQANRPGRGGHIATASFMVEPSSTGYGVGRELGSTVIDWARSSGYRGIQFNAVVETNTAAVRLWQSLGFRVIGTVPGAFDHPEHGYVGLHVMFLSLVDERT